MGCIGVMILLVAGASALCIGFMWWFKPSMKSRNYPFDAHLKEQSFVTNKSTGERMSFPLPTDGSFGLTVDVAYDIFENGVRLSANLPCMGRRSSPSERYQWYTYEQVRQNVVNLASALTSLLNSTSNMIGIRSRNCPEWIYVELACASRGVAVIPLYETFGDKALQHVLREAELEVVVCGNATEAAHLLKMKLPKLRHIIVIEEDDVYKSLVRGNSTSTEVHLFRKILEPRFHKSESIRSRPTPEDLFMICYTSGSAGPPKGVCIKHKHFVRTLNSLCQRLEDRALADRPTHLCYLPLAHILEQLATMATLLHGGQVGFLTTDFSGLLPDLKDIRPTYFFTVPRVLSRIYSSVNQRIASLPFGDRLLRYAVTRSLKERPRGGFDGRSLLGAVLFKKVRSALGGRLRAVLCGGAPMSDDILQFTRAALDVPVLTAYGLTESCGAVSISYFGDFTTGHVGALLPGLTGRLVDVPELDLLTARDAVGEICVKGPVCPESYFHCSEQSETLLDADGWLHTGDLGSWAPNGALKIVGRCKSAFKLAQGEYVSPDRVEAVYQSCHLVAQIYLDGHPLYSFPVAILVPQMNELRKLLERKIVENSLDSRQYVVDWKTMTDEELCSSNWVKAILLKHLDSVGRDNGLKGFEVPKAIHVTNAQFTVENGLLSANLKLCRPNLRSHYSTVIQELYKGVRV